MHHGEMITHEAPHAAPQADSEMKQGSLFSIRYPFSSQVLFSYWLSSLFFSFKFYLHPYSLLCAWFSQIDWSNNFFLFSKNDSMFVVCPLIHFFFFWVSVNSYWICDINHSFCVIQIMLIIYLIKVLCEHFTSLVRVFC